MPHSKRPATPQHVVRMEVDGVLDLHHFKPREVPNLVREYLYECKRLGIGEVRIIHGKGKGVLRAIVQDILAADTRVLSFGPAHDGSGWGVTVVRLKVPDATPDTAGEHIDTKATATAHYDRSWLRLLWKFIQRRR